MKPWNTGDSVALPRVVKPSRSCTSVAFKSTRKRDIAVRSINVIVNICDDRSVAFVLSELTVRCYLLSAFVFYFYIFYFFLLISSFNNCLTASSVFCRAIFLFMRSSFVHSCIYLIVDLFDFLFIYLAICLTILFIFLLFSFSLSRHTHTRANTNTRLDRSIVHTLTLSHCDIGFLLEENFATNITNANK